MKKRLLLLGALLAMVLTFSGCTEAPATQGNTPAVPKVSDTVSPAEVSQNSHDPVIDIHHVPAYSGAPYVAIDGNVPDFSPELMTTESSEYYIELDQLGRCGACFANIGRDLMPTEPRGSISSVYPSGWCQNQYDFVDGKSLYNRCHLIGFQLTGENANDHNLITGTRYLNVEGMLPFEDLVADYIKRTDHHVLYRVTPIFEGSDLVTKGVQMEAQSVEDDEISFNVYCYNVQPGVLIDYATGENRPDPQYVEASLTEESPQTESPAASEDTGSYVLNTNTKKFHLPTCSSAQDTKPENRQDYTGSREQLLNEGYTPCGRCKP